MKFILFLLLLTTLTYAQKLRVKADYFESDEKRGVSVFTGHVHVTKGADDLKSKKLTIYTDKNRVPTKYVAEGNVKFKLEDENKKRYKGRAQKVVYLPAKKEYHFFKNVHLIQLGEEKEVQGDKVIFSAKTGKSYAKGVHNNPVIMTFDINEKTK